MDKIIWTKFYQSNLETDPDIKSKNYNRYILFSLKCWVHLWMKDLLGNDIDIETNETPRDKNTYITISFLIDDIRIELNDTQFDFLIKKIEEFDINKFKWIPLYSHHYDTNMDDGTLVPKLWVKQMLKFINLPDTYDTYITNDGLLANLSDNPDYANLLRLLMSNVRQKLLEMYITGFIFKPSKELIDKWKLIPYDTKGGNREYLSLQIDQDTNLMNQSVKTINYLINYNEQRDVPYNNLLYKVNWNNNRILGRFPNMTDFIISRMKGERDIEIIVDLNLYDMHEISKALYRNGLGMKDFVFTENGINFNADNYDQAIKISNVIYEYLENKPDGLRLEIGFLKAKHLKEFDNVKEGVLYMTNDQERPYTASFLNTPVDRIDN